MSSAQISITETNEAGEIVAQYVHTSDYSDKDSRVDVIRPETKYGLWMKLVDVFLPAGYPQSVTDDYTQYQIYDSLQAFTSSIAGLLASRAVLQGVGVGDASATPTAALLLSTLQDSTGRIATILFAHRFGTALEPECKMYRLLADIFNDISMILDCLSPVFPRHIRVVILSTSSILRALCGVTAGSAKASLSAHFAKWSNLGELNAKDSSQETVISLLGMLAGSVVVSWVTTPFTTWTTLILLLSVHLLMNYAAVRAVKMTTLNQQRATIVMSRLIADDTILDPTQVSAQERIFERPGVIRDNNRNILGHCKIGVTAGELLRCFGRTWSSTGAVHLPADSLPELLKRFEDEKYMLHLDRPSRTTIIVLKESASTRDQLHAWYRAVLAMHSEANVANSKGHTPRVAWPLIEARLLRAGWNLDTAALECHSGTRIATDWTNGR